MRLNPYHPEWYWVNLGSVLYEAGNTLTPAEAFGRVTGPGYWVHCRLAGCYAQLGRMNEAKEAAADALRLRPDFLGGEAAAARMPTGRGRTYSGRVAQGGPAGMTRKGP